MLGFIDAGTSGEEAFNELFLTVYEANCPPNPDKKLQCSLLKPVLLI